jgi:mitogen-activated protein kinase kinase
MKEFEHYIDSERGYLTFQGQATISDKGVDFSDGTVFRISLDEVEKLDELGKGNYGTVYKVRHSKPRVPRFGPGLAGAKHASLPGGLDKEQSTMDGNTADTSGMVMAMKEIRLELDEAKFTTILKELVILHECVSPYIIDFYGAFFQESAVYMCIEYMDGGSIDKLYSGGIPENVLRTITYCTVMGLKELKEKHNIIHRDVKPTNILANSRGQVKICDFGVSGNLVASIAKTNIGCQSYMAPERISGGAFLTSGASDGTYSVQSDIWSLGLTVIECAMGKYPYPPEVSSTIFSQLSVSRINRRWIPSLILTFTPGHRRRRPSRLASRRILRYCTTICSWVLEQGPEIAAELPGSAGIGLASRPNQAGDDCRRGRRSCRE